MAASTAVFVCGVVPNPGTDPGLALDCGRIVVEVMTGHGGVRVMFASVVDELVAQTAFEVELRSLSQTLAAEWKGRGLEFAGILISARNIERISGPFALLASEETVSLAGGISLQDKR